MSNVIQLNVPSHRQGAAARRAALVACFAQHRRFGDDVFWLKENAELLNILECTGLRLEDDALALHRGFYAQVEKRLGFFPQYYRFLLSICLDLEDLGLEGTKAEALCYWAAREGLADAELSDLQRAEARRLMQRRGIDPLPEDTGLNDRLHRFIDRPETFAMPNKKAAYELTHIVFYLSEYGRRDPRLSPAALTSLEFAGILAYLDQNADLLAEICVALRFAGAVPSPIWEDWLERETHRFSVVTGPQAGTADDYHEYFVCSWLTAVSGRDAFPKPAEHGRMAFHRAEPFAGPLREMSECMFRLEDARSDDWEAMRGHVEDVLTDIGHDILTEAQASSPRFAEFFAGFARTGLRGVALLDAAAPGAVLGAGLVVVYTALISSADAITKLIAGGYGAPQLYALSGLIVIGLSVLADRHPSQRRGLATRCPRAMALRSVATVLAAVAFFHAFRLLPLAEVFLFIGLMPILAGLMSGPVLGEPVRPAGWAALAAGFVGVLCLFPSGLHAVSAGHLWAFAAAVSGTFSMVMARFIGRHEANALAQVFYPNLALAAAMAVALPFVWRPMPLADLGWVAAYSGLLFAARWLLVVALRLLAAFAVTPLMNLQFVWMVILGAVIFHEYPAPGTYLGVAIVVGTGVFLIWDQFAPQGRDRLPLRLPAPGGHLRTDP